MANTINTNAYDAATNYINDNGYARYISPAFLAFFIDTSLWDDICMASVWHDCHVVC